MANILEEQLETINSYELCIKSRQIKNISNDISRTLNDAVKILGILDSLFINYSMDSNYNFQLFPEYSHKA